jgi:DNA-binding transcriptional regulator LsrR (DeoR family)
MTIINIKVDLDRFTLDDVIAMESRSAASLRDTIAKCLLDANGNFMETNEARKVIGGLTLRELQTVSAQFAQAMGAAKDDALPPIGSGRQ